MDARQREAKANKREQAEKDILLSKVRELAKTEQGKSFIWEILSICSLYTPTFTGNSQGAFLEGRRSVGLDVLSMLEDADKTIYPRLLLEKQEKS